MASARYETVILDVDAFDNYESIATMGETFYSTEVYLVDRRKMCKSEGERRFLERVRSFPPSEEALASIRSFAEDAGEYDRLTELDILFMALVYDIERKQIGMDHINRVPVLDKCRYFQHTNKLREVGVNVCAEPCLYFSMPGGCSRGNACFYKHPGDIDNRPIPRAAARLDTANEGDVDFFPLSEYSAEGSHVHGGSGSLVVEEAAEPEPEESRWIGEEELGSFEMNVPTESKPSRNHVVCCTGNSSIQAVLLQMGFQLLSPTLHPITKMKTWTRKCARCYRVCRDTTKVFCPFCGSPSLKRVQAFFTSDGIVGIGDFPFLLDKANAKRKHRTKKG
ncbi:RNA-binding protein nob1 [Blastocystis sp. ATCC 50177/Nand II]|uniref:RNA-binding protein nob1 n=1 Tax=Blastocystis sp. subtype 1 (strain ATCC 50177 / NandII) TaxID=478820 RepID=A0A196SPN1_BLAHN|nr:RNA-binding protein nob1 [Blastocystis sp. ATCC 50177/Nand II]